jgi:23S rRNA pseudouridine2604 synthase
MCEALDYKVMSLTRVRIMNVQLDSLPVGKWRYFNPAEIDKMNQLVAESVKEDVEGGAVKGKKVMKKTGR